MNSLNTLIFISMVVEGLKIATDVLGYNITDYYTKNTYL